MRRREAIALLGSATVALPFAVRAQQQSVPVIAMLITGSSEGFSSRLHAFNDGLAERGFVVGRDVKIEYRFANDKYDQLPEFARELVSARPAGIVTNYPATISAKAATTTIPILFVTGGDPVKLGLVQSLNQPGGNITGISNFNSDLGSKRLELLSELVPRGTVFAILANPRNPNAIVGAKSLQSSADTMGLKAELLNASTEEELGKAFGRIRKQSEALVIVTDAFFINKSTLLGSLCAQYSVPGIFEYRDFAAAGGLVSYGTRSATGFRILGQYAGRILKGEKPGNLPVQQSTTVELIINLKAAKVLGITVPLPLLGRADEVIE